MKLNEKTMKRILKEEYNKRINYFLNEKITIIDKRGVNILQYAKGLKVLDQAGNQYTFDTIVKKGKEEFAKLYLPDEPREDALGDVSYQSLREDDRNEIGFYSRSKDGVRDIQPVEDNNEYLFGDDLDYDNDYDENYDDINLDVEEEQDTEEDLSDMNPKLPDRKYILVPMGEFEERFRLKTEEE